MVPGMTRMTRNYWNDLGDWDDYDDKDDWDYKDD